jgi:hypothetical protein
VISFARKVGRLIEIRVEGRGDTASTFGRLIALANELGPDARVVACWDVRAVQPAPAQHHENVANAIRLTARRLERGAVLAGEGLAATQVERTVAAVANPGLRAVRTVADAVAWLEPALNPAELARLKLFLG